MKHDQKYFFRYIYILIYFSYIYFSACTHTEPSLTPKEAHSMDTSIEATFEKLAGNFKFGEISQLCQSAIQKTETELKTITELSPSQRTIDNTLIKFETCISDLSDFTAPLTFMASVSPQKELNNEGSKCSEILGDYMVQVFTRRPLYDALKGLTGRSPGERRLLSETLKSFEKNGLKLEDSRLSQVRNWMQDLNRKEVEFSKNLAQDTSFVTFSPEELKGAQDGFLSRLEKLSDGSFKVSTKSTDFTHVMENVESSESRRKMLFAYMNRGGKTNQLLLEDSLVLRHRIASELGFKNWADYQSQDRMAENSENITQFLQQLKNKLQKRGQTDLKHLLDFKKKSQPDANEIYHWDIPYYAYQLKKSRFNLDDELLREYFPSQHVVQEMFKLYSHLLGVEFLETKTKYTWSPDVQLYAVRDIHGSRKGQIIGYFYTDFIPRPLKYGHAAAFTLHHGRRLAEGNYSKPISAIVANMTPPTAQKPSLLSHSEVVTLFHEFGHIMHQVLTQAEFASLAGTSVARDFVEAPSQMLENWVWNPEILKTISGHFQDLNKKLPQKLVDQLIAARDFNQGYFYCRQLYFGLLDLKFHTNSTRIDTVKTADRLFEEMFRIPSIQGGNFPATFGHLMGGYDAGYYGYLWSEVYAADLFSLFETQGVQKKELGLKYRQAILEKGNIEPAMNLLVEFLGRKPNANAFFKKLHM